MESLIKEQFTKSIPADAKIVSRTVRDRGSNQSIPDNLEKVGTHPKKRKNPNENKGFQGVCVVGDTHTGRDVPPSGLKPRGFLANIYTLPGPWCAKAIQEN